VGDPTLDAADDDLQDEAPARPARPVAAQPARATSAPADAPARPSITGAFRTSFRPIDLRGDLRALPGLLLSKAFLVPLDLSGAAFVAFAYQQDPLTAFFYQYFSYQFPVAAVFVVGFFAQRASWLLGGIIAIAATLFQLPLLIGQPPELVGAVLVQGAIYGSFFGAAAAWYRRFLNRANPNRMAARPASATSHRPDGKIPRKPEQRPMLARRR
jgi:hypothetical protein